MKHKYLQGDTPEHLSDGSGKRLERIGSLSSSQTDQLSTGERESGGDENGAEALEAIVEGTRVIPSACTPVLRIQTIARASAADEYEGDDHEDDSGRKLQTRRPEFLFGVSKSSENVDEDDEEPKDDDEDSKIDALCAFPVLHCEASNDQFKR